MAILNSIDLLDEVLNRVPLTGAAAEAVHIPHTAFGELRRWSERQRWTETAKFRVEVKRQQQLQA